MEVKVWLQGGEDGRKGSSTPFWFPTHSHLPPWAVLSCSFLPVPEEAPVASAPPAPHPDCPFHLPCHSLSCKKLHPSQNTEFSPDFGRQMLGVRVDGSQSWKRGRKRRDCLISPLRALVPTCCQRAKGQGF